MSLIGSSIAQSIAGLSQAERAEAKAKAPAASKDAKRKDERDRVVVGTETADAVRDPKSNDHEEAREDRQEHPGYSPHGSVKPPPPPAHLDVNG